MSSFTRMGGLASPTLSCCVGLGGLMQEAVHQILRGCFRQAPRREFLVNLAAFNYGPSLVNSAGKLVSSQWLRVVRLCPVREMGRIVATRRS